MTISGIEDSKNETIEVRLLGIMKPDDESQKWRAWFNKGGDQRLTLYRNDMDLLVICGCSIGILSKKEMTFKAEEQPLVRLTEERGKFTLSGVFRSGKYISYEEGKALVTQSKIVPTAEVTINGLNNTVDALFKERMSQRNQQRAAEDTVLAPNDAIRESAEIYGEVLLHIDTMIDKFGKVQLAALWKYRQSGTYRALPGSPQGVHDAIHGMNLHNRDYTLSLAYAVDRIFSEVDAAGKAGKPFLHPKTSLPITCDYLIVTPGLIQKLKKNSEHYAQLIDREAKQAFLGAIVTETALKVDALREAGSKITDTSKLIPFKIEEISGSTLHRIIMDVDDAQLLAFKRKFAPMLGPMAQ